MRKNLWDEEDRLRAVNLNPDDANAHPVAVYTYDAGGQRVVRYIPGRLDVRSNANMASKNERDEVIIYPSPMVTAKALSKPGNAPKAGDLVSSYTKHYYIGSERVSSTLGTVRDLGLFLEPLIGAFPNIRPLADETVQEANTGLTSTYTAMEQGLNLNAPVIEGTIKEFKHKPDTFDVYWYHSDHLGSSSYISNMNGTVSQHMEYLPFGELLVDEHLNSYNTPFKFNGKELDEETGNYYYGARYYDPKTSIWLSVDPLAEQMPEWSSYNYTFSNPIRFTDPTGMAPETPDDWIYDVKNKKYIWDGNVNKPKDTPEGYDYVGRSINDVKNHYNSNVRTTSRDNFFGEPEFGENRTPWPGEITAYRPSPAEKLKDFGIENNIPFTESSYEIADDVTVFLTSFALLNPKNHPIHLDGSNANRGSSEHISSGINGYLTILPMPKFNIRGFNMGELNKFFKGTLFNQLSPKIKGTTLKMFNYIMKKTVTPKNIIKKTKSNLEQG